MTDTVSPDAVLAGSLAWLTHTLSDADAGEHAEVLHALAYLTRQMTAAESSERVVRAVSYLQGVAWSHAIRAYPETFDDPDQREYLATLAATPPPAPVVPDTLKGWPS